MDLTRTTHLAEDGRRTARPLATHLFTAFALLLLPLMVGLSFDYGYTWDEKRQQKHGELVWEYLSGARDRSVFEGDDPSDQLYGGLFEVACVAAQKLVPRADAYVVRHVVNAAVGWVGVLGCGLLARQLFGTWAGLLAMALLVLTPPYFGHSMNNPKDIPFAAFFVLALYYVFKIGPTYPYISWRHAAKLACAIALAVAVRAVGLLLFAYLGTALLYRAAIARDVSPRHLAGVARRLGAIVVAALLLATPLWPWALVRPLYGPVLAFFRLSRFDWAGAVLYRGTNVAATALPWHYVPTWFLITTPFVVLIGAACSVAWTGDREGWRGRGVVAMLWAFTLFPVVMVIARGSTLYDGIRHLLFLVPIVAVLAAAGWVALLRNRAAAVRRFSAAALCLGLLEPLVFDVRNHPNEVVYFNALAGGPAGAFGRYDLDYWGNCVYESMQWADGLAQRAGSAVVVSGGESPHVQLDAHRFRSLVYRPRRYAEHHLEIFMLRGSADEVRAVAARDALFRVTTADGATLCVVRAGPRYDELAARLDRR